MSVMGDELLVKHTDSSVFKMRQTEEELQANFCHLKWKYELNAGRTFLLMIFHDTTTKKFNYKENRKN